MKNDIELYLENLNIKFGSINNTGVVLITPKMEFEWKENNLYNRSIVMCPNLCKVYSRGFEKFFNMYEKPDIGPEFNLLNCEFREKIDGSLLIVSSINGELNFRTRGTLDITQAFPNSVNEIESFKSKYKKMFKDINRDPSHSYLFEYTTPTNVIVINYGSEPDIRLIGRVKNTIDYNEENIYATQDELDTLAKEWGIDRPKKYKVNSQKAIDKLMTMSGIEGFVVYSNVHNQQWFRKLKTEEYLEKHRARSCFNFNFVYNTWLNIANLSKYDNNVVNQAFAMKRRMLKMFDFEIVESNDDVWDRWYTMVRTALETITKNTRGIPQSSYFDLNKKEFALLVNSLDLKPIIRHIEFLKYKYKDDDYTCEMETFVAVMKALKDGVEV